ncbi:hypothetical protein [Patiriisocius marinus]|nr:hypothetical protein [Patiriisocius marinus]
MIHEQKSLFNLIEIFRNGKKKMVNTFNKMTHCENKSLHDYYCDAE